MTPITCSEREAIFMDLVQIVECKKAVCLAYITNFTGYLYVLIRGGPFCVEILISLLHASRQSGCLSLSVFTSLIQRLFLTCCTRANLHIYCHYAN